MSLKISKFKTSISPDEVWLGHNKAKSRKKRTVKKGEEDEKNALELSGLCNNKQ